MGMNLGHECMTFLYRYRHDHPSARDLLQIHMEVRVDFPSCNGTWTHCFSNESDRKRESSMRLSIGGKKILSIYTHKSRGVKEKSAQRTKDHDKLESSTQRKQTHQRRHRSYDSMAPFSTHFNLHIDGGGI